MHETYNTELTSETTWKTKLTRKTKHNTFKDFRSWLSHQKCTTKLGESHQGNLSVEGQSVSVKIKPLFWTPSCNLSVQTPVSFPMHVTSGALWHTQLRLHLLQNIIHNNYNNSHTHKHTHTIILPNQFLHLKRLSQLVLKSNQGAELHVWCRNHKELKMVHEANFFFFWEGEGAGMIAWKGLVTYNVPIHQLKLYYTSSTPLLLHCSESTHTHPLPSFSPSLVSSPCHHCTACSLAVLPESWGFITSGSSGGLEKASMCSCSNISSGGQRRKGNISSIVTEQRCTWLRQSCHTVAAVSTDCCKSF